MLCSYNLSLSVTGYTVTYKVLLLKFDSLIRHLDICWGPDTMPGTRGKYSPVFAPKEVSLVLEVAYI